MKETKMYRNIRRIACLLVACTILSFGFFMLDLLLKEKPTEKVEPTKEPVEILPEEYVIAHYNENLRWMRRYKNITTVYHKGNPFERPHFPFRRWKTLKNVGREAHTYLYHIVNNYDSLADITVFNQGHTHSNDGCWKDPRKYVEEAKKGVYCKPHGEYNNWGRIKHIDHFLDDIKSGKLKASEYDFGEFFEELFDKDTPVSIPICLQGCFSLTRVNAHRRPLSFWKKALSLCNHHDNPEEAHYFERLWYYIINP